MSNITIQEAIQLANIAHWDQMDKQNKPYILHPLRVMANVPEPCKIVAILHDVVEDTPIELEDIEGMTDVDRTALGLVSRPPERPPEGPSYREWIQSIARAPGRSGAIARIVKQADILDNLGRLGPPIDPGESEALQRRYYWAMVPLSLHKSLDMRELGIEPPPIAIIHD